MNKQQRRELVLRCDCGCSSQLMIQMDISDGDLQIDCRDDGRHKWHGVWLDKDKKQKVIDFLNEPPKK